MINVIKKTVVAVSILSSGLVAAGTMGPIEAPPSWTGFYAGLNAGGIWGESQSNWDVTNVPPSADPVIIAFTNALVSETITTLKHSGFTGGGQIGYNYQMNNMLFGVEGDFNYADFESNRNFVSIAPPTDNPRNFIQNASIDWLSTIRGRLGYINNNWVIYGTGGLAITHVNYFDENAPGDEVNRELGIVDQTQTGWTAGAGVEWGFSPNWSAKVEYKYVDFDNKSTRSQITLGGGGDRVINFNHDFSANLVTVGINRRFG